MASDTHSAEKHQARHETRQLQIQSEKEEADAAMNGSTSKDVQRIVPLSSEAISQIHSSKHITSLQGVVLSLLENSLDAGSTKISITVDWKRGCCTIDDDGVGIPSAEFVESGGLGRMYCTSKRAPTGTQPDRLDEVHGSNGMFIAELAAMSLLNITSTHTSTGLPASITIHQSKVLTRRLPVCGMSDTAQSSGTSVVVKDLFGNMPVRVKQRALSEDGSRSHDRAWHELKHGIVAFLQAWPRPCSVRLQDTNDESRAINIAGQHHSVSNSLTEKSLYRLGRNNMTSRYDLRDALPMLFQAGLASSDSRQRWVPVAANSTSISLKGLICLDPAPSKFCQLISIGIRPCGSMSGQSELHDTVNKVFDSSNFGTAEEVPESGANQSPSKTRSASSGGIHSQLRKSIDRHPMYSIQINFRAKNSATALNPDRLSESSLTAILGVMTAAVHAWLEKHHFRPRDCRKCRKNQPDVSSNLTAQHARLDAAQANSRLGSAMTMQNGRPLETSSRDRIDMLSTPKRRRVIDLSLRPASRESHIPLALDHGTLSNIRTGDLRAASGPKSNRDKGRALRAELDQTRPLSEPNRPEIGLNSQAIEVGALNGRPQSYSVEAAASMTQSGLQHAPDGHLLSSEDFGSIDDSELIAAENGSQDVLQSELKSSQANDTGEDATITWTDPATGQLFSVNGRTGVVLPVADAAACSKYSGHKSVNLRQRAGIDTTLSSAGRPLSLSRRKALAENDVSTAADATSDKWLPGFLRKWNNPVFAGQHEAPILTASLHGPGVVEFDDDGKCCSHDADGRHAVDRDALQTLGTKLSKAALQRAKVIGQVDRKFILCKLSATESEGDDTFVLVDQHAASERIILEDLFNDLCDPDGGLKRASLEHETPKAKPLHFQVCSREHELFQHHHEHFAAWGIIYTLSSTNPSPILKVTHLPTLVATRCAHLPSLAIDILRSELWALADGSKRPLTASPSKSDDSSPLWLSFLPLMPTKLLEMLHSRACRSAVMFNDVLSTEDCDNLMAKVARCAFPFVCAHGRVGMVPVLELNNGEGRGLGVKPSLIGEACGLEGHHELDREATCGLRALGEWMAGHQKEAA